MHHTYTFIFSDANKDTAHSWTRFLQDWRKEGEKNHSGKIPNNDWPKRHIPIILATLVGDISETEKNGQLYRIAFFYLHIYIKMGMKLSEYRFRIFHCI